MITNFPTFAPGWKKYSTILEGQERENAIEKGLSPGPDLETYGISSINKALIMNEIGDYESVENLLLFVIVDPTSALGNVELAKFVFADIIEE